MYHPHQSSLQVSSPAAERSAEIEEGEQKVLHGEKEAEESKKGLLEIK